MYIGTIRPPLVSVIVINFNYGRFLEQCLLSIARQSYPFIECIVFDNASTDNSEHVLQSVAARGEFDTDGRSLSIIRSDRNLYQSGGAPEAFKRSSGTYIIFFDADDVMLPTCIEAHVRAMLYLHTPVGASCVDYLISSNDDLTVSSCGPGFAEAIMSSKGQQPSGRILDLPPTSSGQVLDLAPSELYLVERTAAGWPWSGTCGFCFRRTMVELFFRRVPQLREQLDSYLIAGVNCLTGSVLINRPLVIYRHHGKNAFAGGAHVANFQFYNRATMVAGLKSTVRETIETLTFIAGDLARFIERNGIFIEAVDTLSSKWIKMSPKLPVSSYTLEYILTNEEKLADAFGASDVNSWIRRYSRTLRDHLFVRRFRRRRSLQA